MGGIAVNWVLAGTLIACAIVAFVLIAPSDEPQLGEFPLRSMAAGVIGDESLKGGQSPAVGTILGALFVTAKRRPKSSIQWKS
jgi:ribose/xylose/arabinose/galactoside ABC-type transport system permease subunit